MAKPLELIMMLSLGPLVLLLQTDVHRPAPGDTMGREKVASISCHPLDAADSSVRVMEAVGAGSLGSVERAVSVDALVAALFETEAARLVSLARFFTDDRTAAEDLVQEAFIRLARSTSRIREREKAAAYLRSIVINLARDHNRRGLVSFRHRPPAGSDEPSAEVRAEDRAARQEVVAALRGLPRRQRECLALRYYLELSIDDTATTLGISANSVKTHVKRGLSAMGTALAPHSEEETR